MFFVIPAPVPTMPELMLRLLVMLFEALFQTSGAPEESMRRLLVGGLIVIALALVGLIARRLLRER